MACTQFTPYNADLTIALIGNDSIDKHCEIYLNTEKAEELDRNERIYVKVETDSDNCCILWHSNDSTWEDLKIEIPFKM